MVQTKARENQGNPFPKLFLLGLVLLLVSLVLFSMANLPGKRLESKFNKCMEKGGVMGFFVNPNKTMSRVCKLNSKEFIVNTLKIISDDIGWRYVSVGYTTVKSLSEYFDGTFYSRELFLNVKDFTWIFNLPVK